VSERTTAAPLPDDLGERIADWYAELTWRRGSTLVQPDDRTWVLLSPEWPRSYANNGILVRADPGGESLLAWGEELLGGAGLEHRHVFALCDLSEQTRAVLAAAGYSVEEEVVQVRPVAAGLLDAPAGVEVEVVPLDEVETLHERLWHEEWMPEADDETVRQLVARRASYSKSGEMLTLLVRDPATGTPAATTDLCVAGWAAEVDGVATRGAYRGRGYGDAMLAAAIAIAAERGCEHVALTAMVEDWPKDWYARRGFITTGPAWSASRHPAGRS
jgi:ribosomal protein S18 acetylase RimI-like enzyme